MFPLYEGDAFEDLQPTTIVQLGKNAQPTEVGFDGLSARLDFTKHEAQRITRTFQDTKWQVQLHEMYQVSEVILLESSRANFSQASGNRCMALLRTGHWRFATQGHSIILEKLLQLILLRDLERPRMHKFITTPATSFTTWKTSKVQRQLFYAR
jgi:hypothetical protein